MLQTVPWTQQGSGAAAAGFGAFSPVVMNAQHYLQSAIRKKPQAYQSR